MDDTTGPRGRAPVVAGWAVFLLGLAVPLVLGRLVGFRRTGVGRPRVAALPVPLGGAAAAHLGGRVREGDHRRWARPSTAPPPGRPFVLSPDPTARAETPADDPVLARRRRLGEIIQALGAVLAVVALWRLGFAVWRLARHDWAADCPHLYVVGPAVFAGLCGVVAARLGRRIRLRAAPRGSG
ncbi:hypothetical protein [Actinosynnema sp. NPDC023587]|uniref:hypothetical protein n=1 Tax=Actinosynnema sp. NPDC023587 TaxID=3154695 RepID=UPI00340C3220